MEPETFQLRYTGPQVDSILTMSVRNDSLIQVLQGQVDNQAFVEIILGVALVVVAFFAGKH